MANSDGKPHKKAKHRLNEGPGADFHDAIGAGDWPLCESLLKEHGSKIVAVKNRSGSTPLMRAAAGHSNWYNHQ